MSDIDISYLPQDGATLSNLFKQYYRALIFLGFFDDSANLVTKTKDGKPRSYLDAFGDVLAHKLSMTDEDRELIVHQCKQCNESSIVITHGTDTMEQTARVLAEAAINKTIILTGAMIPIKFGSSDGLFNLGSALAFAQSLQVGVYIAMNGRYFNWDNVRKNKLSGILATLWDGYDNKANFFLVNFVLLGFAAFVMFILLKWLNKILKENL
jgi:L-asparaginase